MRSTPGYGQGVPVSDEDRRADYVLCHKPGVAEELLADYKELLQSVAEARDVLKAELVAALEESR